MNVIMIFIAIYYIFYLRFFTMSNQQHFELSNSFKSLVSRNQSSSKQKQKPLFSLNPQSADKIDSVPKDLVDKQPKARLQSLKHNFEEPKIFQKQQNPPQELKKKRNQQRKLFTQNDFQQKTVMKNTQKKVEEDIMEQQLPPDVVQPSVIKPILKGSSYDIPPQHTIFHTPLLPVFSSQFSSSLHEEATDYKKVKQKQGVWKIGSIKFNRRTKETSLVIGGIKFDAHRADSKGQAGSVLEDTFYKLPQWDGIWVVQPKEQLYNQ